MKEIIAAIVENSPFLLLVITLWFVLQALKPIQSGLYGFFASILDEPDSRKKLKRKRQELKHVPRWFAERLAEASERFVNIVDHFWGFRSHDSAKTTATAAKTATKKPDEESKEDSKEKPLIKQWLQSLGWRSFIYAYLMALWYLFFILLIQQLALSDWTVYSAKLVPWYLACFFGLATLICFPYLFARYREGLSKGKEGIFL